MSSRRLLSKSEKSLFLVCVFALIPLAAVVFIAVARDAEPSWNIAPATPPPKPNGYDFYVAASKAKVHFNPEVDPVYDTTPYSPNSPYALKNYSLARRTQWVKANSKTFALLNQGLITPSQAPDYATKPTGDWGLLRELSRFISIRTRTFQIAKEPMRATQSALDGMQMAQDSTHGGGLIARMIGIAMETVSRAPLEDWNKTINSLSGDKALAAAQRLEALLSHEPTAAQTLLINKRDSLIGLHRAFTTQGWRGSWSPQSSGLFIPYDESYVQAWQRQITPKRMIYANLNRLLDAEIKNATLPYSQSCKATLPNDLDAFTRQLNVSLNRFMMNEARSNISNNMLLLRLALRAYIAHHKQAPSTLAALVPVYLKAIPTDVYNDGKPLFYQPKGATYTLWSVGPDGINDNGAPLARKPSDKPNRPTQNLLDSKGDFVAGLCR